MITANRYLKLVHPSTTNIGITSNVEVTRVRSNCLILHATVIKLASMRPIENSRELWLHKETVSHTYTPDVSRCPGPASLHTRLDTSDRQQHTRVAKTGFITCAMVGDVPRSVCRLLVTVRVATCPRIGQDGLRRHTSCLYLYMYWYAGQRPTQTKMWPTFLFQFHNDPAGASIEGVIVVEQSERGERMVADIWHMRSFSQSTPTRSFSDRLAMLQSRHPSIE